MCWKDEALPAGNDLYLLEGNVEGLFATSKQRLKATDQ